MKACGISLYRVALPMLVGALFAGAVLFVLDQSILGPSNRQAAAIRHVIRGGSIETFDVLNRQWLAGSRGEIYHFNYFNPARRQLVGLEVFEFGSGRRAFASRTYADRATYVEGRGWTAVKGWRRDFDDQGNVERLGEFAEQWLPLEPITTFATQQPDPKFMSYTQLRRYIAELRDSGFDVSEQQVALERKLSFPFVTLIMTLIAVPFAVTTGRRGALYGIGVGIVLAISYWTTISVFAALGTGGVLAPLVAAWAPNVLFGTGAAYLLLTVRT
jgi:LPS export ABC transporter permease LptG